jgi:hypothetical protein
VLKKEAELSGKVEQACKWLHLKRHIVGNKEVALYGPGPSPFLRPLLFFDLMPICFVCVGDLEGPSATTAASTPLVHIFFFFFF